MLLKNVFVRLNTELYLILRCGNKNWQLTQNSHGAAMALCEASNMILAFLFVFRERKKMHTQKNTKKRRHC